MSEHERPAELTKAPPPPPTPAPRSAPRFSAKYMTLLAVDLFNPVFIIHVKSQNFIKAASRRIFWRGARLDLKAEIVILKRLKKWKRHPININDDNIKMIISKW